MSYPNGEERARYVRALFGRIADRYDLMNRLISFGQDRRWRREAVRQLRPRAGELLLDLGAGTGDLAHEILSAQPNATVIAADFTPEMIAQAQQSSSGSEPVWVVADALHLPFANGTFSGVASGFLLRNVAELERVLREQARVVASGGRVVSLETAPPPRSWLRPLLLLHFRVAIPLLGALLAWDRSAYRYLPSSTESFLQPRQLSARFEQAGLTSLQSTRMMFGTVAILSAQKP